MEFRITGVLDVNGQLQSVQTNCAQTGQMVPWGMPAPGNCSCQTDGACGLGTKMVNYAVKKDLDQKMHAKVDEMANLMVELAHVQERSHTYRKLNKEYEEKLERYEREIRRLQDSNSRLLDLLREHDIPVPEMDTKTQTDTGGLHSSITRPKVVCSSSCSSHVSSRTSATSSTTYRKSMTVIDVRQSTISLTDSLYSEAVTQTESTGAADDSAACHGTASDKRVSDAPNHVPVGSYSKPRRPNKLDIPEVFKGCCSENIGPERSTREQEEKQNVCSETPPGRDKNKENDCKTYSNNKKDAGDSLNNGMYKGNASGAASKDTIEPGCEPHPRDRSFTNESGPRNCVFLFRGDDLSQESNDGCVRRAPQLPVDGAGYLILMVPTNGTLTQNDGSNEASDGSQSISIPEVDVDVRDQCSCSQCHDNNQVHVSWREFHNCRHSTGSPQDLRQSRENAPDADEILESVIESRRNAHKDRKRNGIYSVIKDLSPNVFDEKVPAIGDSEKDADDEKNASRAPLPLPRDSRADLPSPSSEGSRPKSRLRSSGSSMSPSDTSPDSRRDEDSFMKLMRKTSEWNSTKKAFLAKSVTSTSHDADNTLGAVVMKTIEAFKELLENTQRRWSNNLSDKIIKTVKESLNKKHGDDVITTEFLEKCVQLCEREFL